MDSWIACLNIFPDVIVGMTLSRRHSNAYMLVYIQKSKLDEVQIPEGEIRVKFELMERFKQEKIQEELERKRSEERRLYANLRIIRHRDLENFAEYEPRMKSTLFVDFCDFQQCNDCVIKVKKDATQREVYKVVSNVSSGCCYDHCSFEHSLESVIYHIPLF